MHKVIVEEPRHGGGRNKNKRRANLPDELLPKKEGIRRPYSNRKMFGEHLGPLKRWLRSNVGRHWNDVYSEASRVITADNPVRAHIRVHMFQMVQRHTFMREGEVWCFSSFAWPCAEQPVSELGSNSRWPTFYIHPETGVLCEAVCKRRKRQGWPALADQKWITDSLVLRRLNGLWFECKVLRFPDRFVKGDRPWRFDLAEGREICCSQARDIYQNKVYCVAKRQLSRKKLKQFGLKNSLAPSTPLITRTDRVHQSFALAVLMNPVSSSRPVSRAAQAAVRKTADAGANPARDSISSIGVDRHTPVFQTGIQGALP